MFTSFSAGVKLLLSVLTISLLLTSSFGANKRRHRKRLPLREEKFNRRHRNSTDCHFGSRTYEIEERWSPDLGPPFGIMYCVRCECLAIPKKRRIIGRVTCRNIKNECPKPNCKDPVLLPKRCCKTCPGKDNGTLEEDLALSKKEMEVSSRKPDEFVTLMTGQKMSRSPRNTVVLSSGAARGHFRFQRRNLHYTVYTKGLDRPTSVRFVDNELNIVEEHELDVVTSSSSLSKVCGVWRKLPRMYRRMLQKERLSVVVATSRHPEGEVAGKIIRYAPLINDLFESVLIPDTSRNLDTLGAGGMASVSVEKSSILLSLAFNGIFVRPRKGKETSEDFVVEIKLQKYVDRSNGLATIKSSTATISKPAEESDMVSSMELSLSHHEMKSMSRGKMLLTVRALDSNRSLRGNIVARQTCYVFQAVLSGEDSFEEVKPNTGAAGYGLIDLNEDGSIDYKIHLQDLSGDVVSLTIDSNNQRRNKELEDALPVYMNGWANGTYAKTVAKDVETLMSKDMFINVGTEHLLSEIRGRVDVKLFNEAHRNKLPILLKGNGTSAAGVAWLYVDRYCRLHYDVSVSGMSYRNSRKVRENKVDVGDERHVLELVELPGASRSRRQHRTLHKFDGVHVSSFKDDLNEITLSRLDSGVCYLKLTSKHYRPKSDKTKTDPVKVLELKARIRHVKVPSSCMPKVDEIDPRLLGGYVQYEERSNLVTTDRKDNAKVMTCYYEGKIYEDGTQWMAEHDKCMMCSCQRKRVVCDPVVCPDLNCPHSSITLPGECCATCRDLMTSSRNNTMDLNVSHNRCFFDGDQRFHAAGTRWHPYLPPNGFTKCAICTCKASTLTVECYKIKCRPLTCPEESAYREHPMSCCKRCPVTSRSKFLLKSGDSFIPRDETSEWTVGEILNDGGCKFKGQVYKNGDTWHPVILPFGTIRSVRCHCKDGKAKCRRRKICSSNWSSHGNIMSACSGADDHPKQRTSRRKKQRWKPRTIALRRTYTDA